MSEQVRPDGIPGVGVEGPFAVGSLKGPVALPADPSRWLVNYDWGDNGLRPPFLGEAAPGEAELAAGGRRA